jgi:hypothetical protein
VCPGHRSGLILGVLLLTAPLALSACGENGTTSRNAPKLSRAQQDNAQRLNAYVVAFERILTPLSHQPANPTDYLEAGRALRAATKALAALVPPPQFRTSHDRVLRGMLGQLALNPKFQQAARAHDTTALHNVQAENARQGEAINAALSEYGQELVKCQGDNFSC